MLFYAPDNPKIASFGERYGSPSDTWFLESTRVYPPIGISIGSAVFAGLTHVKNRQTDTQTDHATPSVALGCI